MSLRKLEDRNDADTLGALGIVGEPGIAAGLLSVDAIALVALELANGDRVSVGSTLDRALASGPEVVVPVGVGRRASPGREYEDDVVVSLVGQVHRRVDVLPAALAAVIVNQDYRRAFEDPADAALVGTELIDGLGIPVVHIGHFFLLGCLRLRIMRNDQFVDARVQRITGGLRLVFGGVPL